MPGGIAEERETGPGVSISRHRRMRQRLAHPPVSCRDIIQIRHPVLQRIGNSARRVGPLSHPLELRG